MVLLKSLTVISVKGNCTVADGNGNGEGDLVVMDIEAFTRREKMLKLREELLVAEEDRLAVRPGCTPEELDIYLDGIIDEVEHGKDASL